MTTDPDAQTVAAAASTMAGRYRDDMPRAVRLLLADVIRAAGLDETLMDCDPKTIEAELFLAVLTQLSPR